MTLSPAWLDELRSRTLLSALIGRSIKVTRAGREHKACCPFHNEKTPSFTINDDKGFYHCFGCSAHGDAISWMTDHRGLPFMDAVKELADAAGMEVPAPDPRAAEKAERANSLYDVTAAAAEWFQAQLNGIEGAQARSYLEQRGITAQTIADFGLGYAPDSRAKLKTALAHLGDARLIEAGLLITVDDKAPYDRFRGRLMIPIRDARGRVIAFGGRILGAGEPKYLNSPDTPLFDKGRTLYNLDRAAAAARKSGRICVVEGYMDVIALAQVGIADAVAPLGTALTEHQIARLWRMTDTPTLCFDGDSAGQKAAVRAIGRALPGLSPSQTLQFVTLPKGQDPDDVIRSGGRKAMIDILDRPEPLVERIWREETASEPLSTPEAKARLKQRLMAHVSAIGHEGLASQYRQEFFSRLDEAFKRPQQPRWQPGKSRFFTPERPLTQPTRDIGDTGIEPLYARAIMAGLLNHPGMIVDCAEAVAQLAIADAELTALRNLLLDTAFDRPGLDSPQLVTICEEAGFERLADSLINAKSLAFSFMRRQADAETARRDLGMVIEVLAARPELDAALAAATARLGETLDEAGLAEQQRLIQARHDVEQRLAALVQRDDGAE